MIANRRTLAALTGLLWSAALLVGCAASMGGLPLDEVSSAPIAFQYWNPEDSRNRQEILDKATDPASHYMPTRAGVARMGGLANLFGVDRQATAETLRRFPSRIALLDPRTLEITLFPGAPPNARPLAWSPDHRRLMFASTHQKSELQIFEYDLDSGELHVLSRGPAWHVEGDYLPDGRIAMSWVNEAGGRSLAGLMVTGTHGSRPDQIIDGMYPSSPRWSPTSNEVVWVQALNKPASTVGVRDQSTIVVQTAEPGRSPVKLARGREPVYTPDGVGIVYTAEGPDGWRLRRMRIDGSGRSPLGRSIREERSPAISPDGKHVVYKSPSDDNIERLYIRRIDGTGDRILLDLGAAAWPVW